MNSLSEDLEIIRKEHHLLIGTYKGKSVSHWSCGAFTAPTENTHQFSNAVKEVRMKCTLDQGHGAEEHRDNNCCWTTYVFSDALVIGREPADRRTCSCGKRWVDCKTGQTVAMIGPLEELVEMAELREENKRVLKDALEADEAFTRISLKKNEHEDTITKLIEILDASGWIER